MDAVLDIHVFCSKTHVEIQMVSTVPYAFVLLNLSLSVGVLKELKTALWIQLVIEPLYLPDSNPLGPIIDLFDIGPDYRHI